MNQLNGMVRSVFQDLVEKRLWPVALAMVVALIAIPVVLSKPASSTPAPAPAAATAPATGSGGSLSAFQPVVSSEGSKSSEIRKALRGFSTKDPFKVQGLKSGGGDQGSVQVEGGDATVSGGGSATGSGSTGGGNASPESTSGSGQSTGTSAPSGPTYYTYTVDVRFGKEGNLDKKRLERFRALPSSQDPVIVFMGVTADGEDAVFLVSSASGTTGEGDCQPDDTCTFLYMKPGQQQAFESVDGNNQVVTYVLKLLEVNVEKTDPPKGTSSASSKASRRAARVARSKRARGFADRIESVGF